MNEIRVLVVDDEQDLMELLVRRLNRKGIKAKGVASAEEALEQLKDETFDVGVFDIRMEGMDGLSLLERIKNEGLLLEVIMLTGHGTIETAIDAMKKGAYDYLTKPYNLAEVEVSIKKAYEKKQLKEENENIRRLFHAKEQSFHIIGDSPLMQQAKELTAKVANSDVSILVEGESGTGKELFAKALHYWSSRQDEPFIAINSGALPDQLLESELFGHAKGAFTGAQKEKKGLVEVAHNGTLFLDEIGEMPLDTQVKLLRFLETGEFRRVGEVKERKVNVRVVTATNRDMEEEVKKANFREDLFYRLQVLKITVPPLRERTEDIPSLVQFFLESKKTGGQTFELSEDALKHLQQYQFPGNVRELFHILERGCLLSQGTKIKLGDLLLPGHVKSQVSGNYAFSNDKLTRTLEEVEKEHIDAVLTFTDWNKSEAAKVLGISVRNIYRKIEQYQISPK
ncbi:sigma-54 dependent transcriptional regulator [Bacillus shivajii]|uniref:sigma-54-dependent transcriptional regulator n=1 Tax=Bacillus shivajii TaxID=1983719 RepID=UPI001CF9AC26|nr:sigma-54 dependent transcriptional regulator [Bacillus shivajii]UCZ52463.1 sigma-54 dependent transcriptional regulator [Bacillus shivajii]